VPGGLVVGELEGKVAVITGGGSGMGRMSARVFVREGAHVLVADVSGDEEATAANLGERADHVHCDVTKEDDVAAMIDTAVKKFGRVDALLNVAGTGVAGPLADVTMEDYDHVFDVDLRGVILGMKYAIRAMRDAGGGSIVNWSSLGGLNAESQMSLYCAAKAGVVAVTKNAATEYGDVGIRVNCLCPGFILSPEGMSVLGAEMYPELATKPAIGRAGRPEEVAELACFLASDRASYVSGAIIPVDGALSCRLP
jgi:NAD(P)-dependent dehydrogenase (short-subunit alcohol dehydrogenase family)